MIYSANVKQRQMTVKESMNSLSVLQKLAPPQVIIHIGAGNGYGEMHQWRQWGVSYALIIDANKDRLEWARPLIAKNPGWHAVSAVLSENEGEVDYYQASNPEEDGLIPPQGLSSLWPNLQATDQSVRSSRRLDHLLAEEIGGAFGQADSIWVLVDCLPALPILRGAGAHIEQWSVLKLRVLLHPNAEIEEDASLQSIEAYLQPLGFQLLEITESNHPAIGYALFARNWKTILHSRTETLGKANAILTDEVLALVRQQEALNQDIAALNKAYEEQEALADLHLAQIESLTQERNSYASQAVERQAQIDTLAQANIALDADTEALAQEKSVLAAQYEVLEQEVAALSRARDQQNEIISQHLMQIEVLTQECVRDASLAAERQAQIDTLGQTISALNADMDELVQERSAFAAQYEALKQEVAALSQARDEQNEFINKYLAQIEALTQERDSHASQTVEWQAQFDTLGQTNVALNADVEALVQEKSALAAQYEALKQEVAVLSKVCDEQSALANQRQEQIETLTQTNVDLKSDKEAIIEEKSALAAQYDTLKQEMAVLSMAHYEQSALANQRQEQIEMLTQERDSHDNQAVKLQAQIDTLTQTNTALKTEKQTLIQEKSALASQHDTLKLEIAALRKARDEQNALVNQRQAQIEVLIKERDSHANQAVKLQAQIDTLTQTNIDLKADKEAIAKQKSVLATQHEELKQEMEVLGKARDKHSALAHQHKALIEILTMPKADHHLEPYVLALNNYDPFTTIGGGATRLQGLYAATAEWSNIVVMCFSGGTSIEVADIGERIKCIRIPKTLEHLKEEKYFNSRFHIPTNDIVDLRNAGRNPVLNDVYDVLRKRASIVVCDHIYMTPLPRHFGDRFVYSSHNFEYKLKKDLLEEHPDKDELIKEVYNAERFCVTTSDLIVAVSAEDSENFTRNFNITAPIIVVPNGASVPVAPNRDDVDAVKEKINSRSVVFLGSAHKPNVDAAKFIVESLALDCPDIKFHLVGSVCLALPSELPANVKTWGVLDESMKSAVLQHCKVAINPMSSGGGSNVKLADFLMNGLYVVSTSFGVRGYPDLINAHVAIANQKSFAEVLQNVLDVHDISDETKRMERQSLFIEHLSMRSLAKQFVDVLSDFDQPKSSQIEALTQERNSYVNQAAEQQAQIEILTQANITLETDKEALTQEKSVWAARNKALKQEVSALSKACNKQRVITDQSKAKIDTLTMSNTALKADNEALDQEKSALIAQYESLKQEVAKLNKICDEQSILAYQRLGQIDTFSQAQAEQNKIIAEYKTELEQLQLKLQQSKARITQLETELAENDARQHLINEEVIKAEAQIELIKDVLLREPGL